MAKTTLTVDVEYDQELTDPEGLAAAMDRLLEIALSTPGILDDYGNPRLSEFLVADAASNSPTPGPVVVVEISGGMLQEAYASAPDLRLVLVDWDVDAGDVGKAPGVVEVLGDHGRSLCASVAEFPAAPIASMQGTDAGTALEKAGIVYQSVLDDGMEARQRWVLYDMDGDRLLTTRTYSSYQAAADDASQVNDVLVLSLECRGVRV